MSEPLDVGISISDGQQAPEDSASLAAPVPDSMQGLEQEDSRTAVAGRKRDFEEATVNTIISDEEPSRKRPRDDGESSGTVSVPPEPALAEKDAGLSQLPSAQASVFSLLGDEHGEDRASVPQAPFDASRPTTWNTGVQSGLRTSFGAKANPKGIGKSVPQVDAQDDSIDIEMTDDERPRKKRRHRRQKYEEYDTQDAFIDDPELVLQVGNDQPQEQSSSTDDRSNDDENDENGEDDGENDISYPPLPPNSNPAQPWQPFKVISKKEKKKLPPAARAAYLQALKAHENASQQRKAANKSQRGLSALQRFRANPSMKNLLSKDEVLVLPKPDKVQYQKVDLFLILGPFEEATRDASTVLQQVRRWPLPQEYKHIHDTIADGRTFYPQISGLRSVFNHDKSSFRLPELLDNNGLPLPLQEFSYAVFTSAFVMENRNLLSRVKLRTVRMAFREYMRRYSHVLPLMPSLAEHPVPKVEQRIFNDAQKTAKLLLSTETSAPGREMQGAIPSASATEAAKKDLAQLEAKSEPILPQAMEIDSFKPVAGASLPSGQVNGKEPVRTLSAIEDPEMRELLVFLQQKYYPSDSDAIRCLSCAKIGHTSDICPELKCKRCGVEGKHSTLMCPRDMPCGKCRAHGHTRMDCPEKLAVHKSEMTCDLCGLSNHLEMECPRLGRSFNPSLDEIKVVSGIPVYCYTCGGADHYGPDCGLYRGKKPLPEDYTFSKSNLFKYLDTTKKIRATAAGIDYSLPPRPCKNNYHIKGKANDPITFDDSDEEEFIRPSVMAGNPSKGNITIGGQGQPPQAPFRFAAGGQGQMTVQVRGYKPKRGKNSGGPNNQGDRPGAPGPAGPPQKRPPRGPRKPKRGASSRP